jgi:DNA-binding transcriptional LysR family regulator
MFSTCVLVRILHAFQKEFPTVSMRLRMEALGAVTQLVMERTCHIGISGWMPGTPDTIERQACGFVTMVPVASPQHPLAQIEGKIPSAVLREHTQLVLTDRSPLTAGQDFGVMALRDWRLGDLSSKHALLRSGIGWGNMPVEMVQWDLDAGRLVQLDIQEGSSFSFPIYVIRRGDDEPGPAAKWLMQQFLDLQNNVADTGSCTAGHTDIDAEIFKAKAAAVGQPYPGQRERIPAQLMPSSAATAPDAGPISLRPR